MAQTHPVKSTIIKIRVDPKQKRDMEAAAKGDGRDLSSWLRHIALREADRRAKR